MKIKHRLLTLCLITSCVAENPVPPQQDTQAILAMAGTYHVDFHFHEKYSLAADYKIKTKPYHEEATEVVKIVEETPTRITLQHLLVVRDKEQSAVIKHWSQVWTWNDPILLDYNGSEDDQQWNIVQHSPERIAGTWTQLITSVDDSPRYEGRGTWTHQNNVSTWLSESTRRPLPRREYSKRDDYDYLLVSNKHVITPDGWMHEQDNQKIISRDGQSPKPLCQEYGINKYVRVEDPATEIASKWWAEKQDFWNVIRATWLEEMNKPGTVFTYQTASNGKMLSKEFREWEKQPQQAKQAASALLTFIVRTP
jgi:hypothetical protein